MGIAAIPCDHSHILCTRMGKPNYSKWNIGWGWMLLKSKQDDYIFLSWMFLPHYLNIIYNWIKSGYHNWDIKNKSESMISLSLNKNELKENEDEQKGFVNTFRIGWQ